MRCHIKRALQLTCTLFVLFIIMEHILFAMDPLPILEEPLQNNRFNHDQVKESNLFLADDFAYFGNNEPAPTEKERSALAVEKYLDKKFLAQLIPVRPTESTRLHDMRAQLRELNTENTKMDDPRLLNILRKRWIRPPSKDYYNLDAPEKTDFSMGQSSVVDDILQQKTNGFFIECGALDGETRSNTLFFERERNWKGLLIEAGPSNYRKMVTKNRKAWSSPACLGVKPYPTVMYFNRGKNRGRLINDDDALQWVEDQNMNMWLMEVECFPIYSLLLALNITTVNYFSLDVEGVELDVLKTIPFDKVDIQVLTVEFKHDKEGKDSMETFMTSKGYKMVTQVTRDDNLANDFVFVKQ